jgi:hypothetical protein
VALIKIGQKCQFLERLDINNCLKVTDEGVVGFMSSFAGALKYLDLSGCINCSSSSVQAIVLTKRTDESINGTAKYSGASATKTAKELLEIRLNGLSKVSAKSLTFLFQEAENLARFEMACELRSSSTHRKSMMPHFSDCVLIDANYNKLEDAILTGCCLISDVGGCSMANKCPMIRKLDVSSISALTDIFFVTLSTTLKFLNSLSANGCIKLTNIGLEALCSGMTSDSLTHLEICGCSMLTDIGW